MHVFYKVLELAPINSWIFYKKVTESSISRRAFIQQVSEEITGSKRAMEFVPSIRRSNSLPSKKENSPVELQNAGIDPHTSVLLAENQSAESVQPKDASLFFNFTQFSGTLLGF